MSLFCHSEAGEESPFSSIFKKGDPSDLRPQDDGQGKLVLHIHYKTCRNFGTLSL